MSVAKVSNYIPTSNHRMAYNWHSPDEANRSRAKLKSSVGRIVVSASNEPVARQFTKVDENVMRDMPNAREILERYRKGNGNVTEWLTGS